MNKISMSSLGLSNVANHQQLDLQCKGQDFKHGNVKVNVYEATCTRVMEPEIIREENSDCGEAIEGTTLVKIGWNFGYQFIEQVSTAF